MLHLLHVGERNLRATQLECNMSFWRMPQRYNRRRLPNIGRPITRQQQLPRRQQQLERLFVLQAARHRRQHHILRRLHHPHVHLKRHVPRNEREPGLRGYAGRWRRRRSYCTVGWRRWRGSAEIRRQSCDQAVIHRDCRCRWTTYSRATGQDTLSRWRTRRKQLV